jgi:nicotinate-nucleotide adenylyltransferase
LTVTAAEAPLPAIAPARVGLVGGSFNPAHSGHLHISQLALEILGLDAVWWLVSPQNPLKSTEGMAPLADRLAAARALAAPEPRVMVTDLERAFDTRYTVDTLAALRERYADTRWVWIMGADNLSEVHQWKDWPRIFELVPVAVFDRPSYSFQALQGVAARRFQAQRKSRAQATMLADMTPPAWVFLWSAFDPASATAIRQGAPQGASQGNAKGADAATDRSQSQT